MKKVFLAFAVIAFMLTACKKEVPETPVNDSVELEFLIEQSDFGGLKSTNDDVPLCSDLNWSYVTFKIDDGTTVTNYTSEVINMPNGDVLTQVVKLPSAGTYKLTEFLVYNDVLPVGPGPEDSLIRAAPAEQSEYWDLMTHPLNLDVVVEDFKKKQITIDVLCFEDLYYESFGFFWFEMNDVKIERQCFFGDVCTGKLADFETDPPSLYQQQEHGVQMDMPAIMKIEVYKEGSLIRTFSNEAWYGEGQCLEVYWANDLSIVEEFQFKLYVWLPYGTGFAWKLIDDTMIFNDGDCPDPGPDGVVDITVGNCNIDGADFVYPAWMNIPDPSQKFHMKLTSSYAPSPEGTYVEALFTGVPSGFDVFDGKWGSWCGDKWNHISINHTYDSVYFINSIQPLPGSFTKLTKDKLNMLNWLFNYLPDYFEGINLANLKDFSGSGFDANSWRVIQDAIWNITDNYGATGKAMTMSNAAIPTFNPMPGQYAAVLMVVENDVQLQFIMIDP